MLGGQGAHEQKRVNGKVHGLDLMWKFPQCPRPTSSSTSSGLLWSPGSAQVMRIVSILSQ
jgi:hypothetical protein